MNPDLHHLAAAYALDALDPDERAAFEAHFPTCEICSADVRADRETVTRLAASAAVAPPPHLKASVMDEIGRTRQLSPRTDTRIARLDDHRRVRPTTMVAVAAAVVALVIGVGVIVTNGDDPLGEVITASDAVVTSLDGEPGSMRIVWSPERRQAVVVANEVPDPGPGRVYALWSVLDDGTVEPAGLFVPGGDGVVRTRLEVETAPPVAWGITIEPDGGSDQPTGDVLYLGEL